MAFMGSRDTLCKVAMLSICKEDTLAYYSVEDFALASRTRWLSRCESSSKAVARQAMASGSSNRKLLAILQVLRRGVIHGRRGAGPDDPDSGILP